MEILKKFTENTILLAVIMTYNLLDIVSNVIRPGSTRPEIYTTGWWIEFGIQLFIALGVVYIWNKFKATHANMKEMQADIKEKTILLDTIGRVRGRELFIRLYAGVEFFRLPNETDEEFKARLPQFGQYLEHIKKEHKQVRDILLRKLKHKTVAQINNMLAEHYPELYPRD